jgi:inhibitor of the pro-sigma K processing machinery
VSGTPAQALLIYAGAVVGLYALVRWFHRPSLWLLQAAWRCLAGGAAVWAVDWAGRGLGLHVALNPVTALIAGFLGVPGLAALAALSALSA